MFCARDLQFNPVEASAGIIIILMQPSAHPASPGLVLQLVASLADCASSF